MPVKKSAKRSARPVRSAKRSGKRGGALAEGLAASGVLLAARQAYKLMGKNSPRRPFTGKPAYRGGQDNGPVIEADKLAEIKDYINGVDGSVPVFDLMIGIQNIVGNEAMQVQPGPAPPVEVESVTAPSAEVEPVPATYDEMPMNAPVTVTSDEMSTDAPVTATSDEDTSQSNEVVGGRPFRFHRQGPGPNDAECTLDKAFRRLLDEYYKFRNASTAPAVAPVGSPKAMSKAATKAATAPVGSPKAATKAATAPVGSPKAMTKAATKAATAPVGSPKAMTKAATKAATAPVGSPKAMTKAATKAATAPVGSPKAMTKAATKAATAPVGSPKAAIGSPSMGLSKTKKTGAIPTPTLWQGGSDGDQVVSLDYPFASAGFAGGAIKKKKPVKKSVKKPKKSSRR